MMRRVVLVAALASIAIVAKVTGRKVIAYISQIHPDVDQAVEVWVLEPTVDPTEGRRPSEPVAGLRE